MGLDQSLSLILDGSTSCYLLGLDFAAPLCQLRGGLMLLLHPATPELSSVSSLSLSPPPIPPHT